MSSRAFIGLVAVFTILGSGTSGHKESASGVVTPKTLSMLVDEQR
jgi:hypothetical protein